MKRASRKILAALKSRGKRVDTGSLFLTNIITCNRTLPDGNVENLLESNAELAREHADNIKL
ncbi:MAG: hypothetical protein ACI4JF_10855 [Oscillospiraceae bacterium]